MNVKVFDKGIGLRKNKAWGTLRNTKVFTSVELPEEKTVEELTLDDVYDADEQADPALYDQEYGQEEDQQEDILSGRGFDRILGEEHKLTPVEGLADKLIEIDDKLEEAGAPISYPLYPSFLYDQDNFLNIEKLPPEPGVFKNNTVMLTAHPLEVGWGDPETELLDDVNLEEIFAMDDDTSEYDDVERQQVLLFRESMKKLMDAMPRVETNPLSALIRHPHLSEGFDVPVELQVDDRFAHTYQFDQIRQKYNLTKFDLDKMMYQGIQTREKMQARRKRLEEKRKEEGLSPVSVNFRWRYDGDLDSLSPELVDKLNFKQLRAILSVHTDDQRFEEFDTKRNGTWIDLKEKIKTLLEAHHFMKRKDRQMSRRAALTKVHYTLERLRYLLKEQEKMYPFGEAYNFGKMELGIMKEWVEDNGGFIDKVEIDEEVLHEERTLLASEDIEPGEMLVMVRNDLMITSRLARASSIGEIISKRCPNITNDHYVMAAYICQEKEKDADSFWAKYLKVLPRKLLGVPYRYTPEDGSEALEGTYAGSLVGKKIIDAANTFEALSKGLPPHLWKKKVALEDFLWALACIDTRAYKLNLGNNITVSALIPVVDMINADPGEPTASWRYDSDLEAVVIEALTPVKKGEEILINYGCFSNTHWFVNYGLLFPDLVWKTTISYDEDTPQIAAFAVSNSYKDPGVQNMFSYLRSRHDIGKVKKTIYEDYEALEKTKDVFAYEVDTKRSKLHRSIRENEFKLGEVEELDMILNGKEQFPEAYTLISHRQSLDPAPLAAGTCTSEIDVLKELKVGVERQVKKHESQLHDDMQHLMDLDNDVERGAVDACGKRKHMMTVKVAEKLILQYFTDLADKCIPLLEMKRDAWREYYRDVEKQSRKGKNVKHHEYIRAVVIPLVRQRCLIQKLRRNGKLPSYDSEYLFEKEAEIPTPEGSLPFPWKEVVTVDNETLYYNPETTKSQWYHPSHKPPPRAQDALDHNIMSRYARLASTWKPIQLEGPGGMNELFRSFDELKQYDWTYTCHIPREPTKEPLFAWNGTRMARMFPRFEGSEIAEDYPGQWEKGEEAWTVIFNEEDSKESSTSQANV